MTVTRRSSGRYQLSQWTSTQLEKLFEQHGICSHTTTTNSLSMSSNWCTNNAPCSNHHRMPLQLTNKQRDVQFPTRSLSPAHFSWPKLVNLQFQVINLTQIWSNRESGIIEYDDLPAIVAGRLHLRQTELNPRSKGTPATYLSYLQPLQRYL